jgi:hypothetical protein
VDNSQYYPAVDVTVFPATFASWFWTSSTLEIASESTWLVNHYDGTSNSYTKSSSYYARCVRGGQ